MTTIKVAAAGTSHDVLIGPLADAASRLRELSAGKLPLVTDARIFRHHGDRVRQLVDFEPILVPEGEAAKGWPTLEMLIAQFARLGLSRATPVVALGGGSVGDVTGLATALFKRGCPVVHVPTTLLAQADSAIGGKTAIDACGQKNLVGAFHPPALVIADPEFLETLDQRQLRAGYAEIVKYGLIDDPVFFRWCEANGSGLLAGDTARRLHAVDYCIRAKARLVAEDFHDRLDRRALLNLGHTFGHAIESAAGYNSVLHGEAVAVGIVLAFRFSGALGLCSEDDAERVEAHLAEVGLPIRLADVELSGRGRQLLPFMLGDKKADHGLTLVLVHGIGQAFVSRDVEPATLAGFLERSG